MTQNLDEESDEPLEVFQTDDGHEFKLVPSGPEGRSLGWFSLKQVKLHLVKSVVNSLSPIFFSLVATGAEKGGVDKDTGDPAATQPVSQLTQRIWQRLNTARERDQQHLLKDENFQRLLRSSLNAIIYISEEDNYWRVWWAYFLTVVWEEMTRYYDQWNPLECPDLGLKVAQFKKDGKTVGLEEAQRNPAFKKQLFYWHLSRHLPYLERYNMTLKPKGEPK